MFNDLQSYYDASFPFGVVVVETPQEEILRALVQPVCVHAGIAKEPNKDSIASAKINYPRRRLLYPIK
jgi:hypothetical protein